MKKILWIIGILLFCAIGIYFFNFITLQSSINSKIAEDSRNNGISVGVHYKYYILTNTLVYNIRSISSDKAPVDVFRVFLQSSSKLKEKSFQKVELAYKGKSKFFIKGEYFKVLGSEYDTQNPIYTTRTFPENLYLLNGEPAYSQWTGGFLGVASKQMDDFKDAYTKWFLNDF